MIGVAVLGSTGSVGESTLDVLKRNPQRFRLVAVAANTNAQKLAQQVLAFQPQYAALADEAAAVELKRLLGARAPGTRVLGGPGALEEIARLPEVQCVMAAIVGAAVPISHPARAIPRLKRTLNSRRFDASRVPC